MTLNVAYIHGNPHRKMRIALTVIFGLWGTIQVRSQSFIPEFKTNLDSSNGIFLMRQCSRSVPENVSGFYNLTPETIAKLERDFHKITSVKASACCLVGGRIPELKSYGYQYLGIEIEGRKYIYVNAFPIGDKQIMEAFHKDWKTKPVVVCDGGDAYWGILYDVQKAKFSQLSINGVG